MFDVTHKSDVYGPGRSYSIFAGKDGSRGLGMSSLKPEDAVADYSTLDEKDMQTLEEWHAFFSYVYLRARSQHAPFMLRFSNVIFQETI